MPQYQPSQWRSKKDVDRLNTRRSAAADFIADFTKRFRPASTSMKRCSRITAFGNSAPVNIGVVRPSAPCSWDSPDHAARFGRRVDLRKKQPYDVYDKMDFDIPVASTAIATTVLVRVEELRHRRDRIVAVRGVAQSQSRSRDDRRSQSAAAAARGDERRYGIG